MYVCIYVCMYNKRKIVAQCVSQVRRRCAVDRKWRQARSTGHHPRYWLHLSRTRRSV